MLNLSFRRRGSALLAATALAFASTETLSAAGLSPASLHGWSRYTGAVEQRIAREAGPAGQFLALDYSPAAANERRHVLNGGVVIEAMDARDAGGRSIDVPEAMTHHWRGAILIPGARLDTLLDELRAGPPRPGQQEDVLDSRVLARRDDGMRVYLKLQRTKIVTVVYNTEHDIRFNRHGAARASSTSTATKIAELADPGTPQERERRPGDDSGFLWRWNTYWRYEEVPGGVIAECESISLSRDVPSLLEYVAGPLIRSTARESMERTLTSLKDRHRH